MQTFKEYLDEKLRPNYGIPTPDLKKYNSKVSKVFNAKYKDTYMESIGQFIDSVTENNILKYVKEIADKNDIKLPISFTGSPQNVGSSYDVEHFEGKSKAFVDDGEEFSAKNVSIEVRYYRNGYIKIGTDIGSMTAFTDYWR